MSNSIIAEYKLLFKDLASSGLLNAANNAKELQKSLSSVGKSMTQNVTLPVLAFGGLALKAAGDFESAMNGVKAVSGATGKEFDALKETAKELGATTQYSATEAGKGMEFLAMAGMNTEQVLSTIPNALNLAAAGNLELAQTADIMSNIMTGMGIAAEDSARVANVLAQAAASANVDVGMLGETMKYAAPIAKTLGLSLEETAAMAGIMGNAGIQASQAGTTLRSMMLRMSTNNNAKGALHELGVSAVDAEGNLRSLPKVLSEIQKSMKDFSEEDQIKLSADLAGVEAVSGFMSILDSIETGGLGDLTSKLKDSAGAAQDMAEIRMAGFNGAIKTAKSAIESLQIAIGESGLLADVTVLIQMFSDFVRQLSKTNPELLNTVVKIGLIAAAIGPLLMGAGLMIKSFMLIGTTLSTVFNVIKIGASALTLLASPIGIAVVAIAALVAAGYLLYKNWELIKAKAVEIFGSLPAPVQEMGRNIAQVFNLIKSIALPVLQVMSFAFVTHFTIIKNVIMTALQFIVGLVSTQMAVVKAVVMAALTVIATVFNTGFNLIKNTVMTALNVIKAIVTGNWQAIPSIIQAGMGRSLSIILGGIGSILSAFAGLAGKLLIIGSQAVQGLINGIRNKIKGAIDVARNLASSVSNTVKSFFSIKSPSRLFAEFGEFLSLGLAGGISAKAGAAISQAKRLASGVTGAASGIGSTLMGDIGRDAKIAAEAKSDLMMTHRFEFDISGKIAGAQAQVNTTYTSNGNNAGSNMPVMI